MTEWLTNEITGCLIDKQPSLRGRTGLQLDWVLNHFVGLKGFETKVVHVFQFYNGLKQEWLIFIGVTRA